MLTLQQWEVVLAAFERLGLLGAREWTVECNPATISFDKAKLLRSYGVNRISMGVQSLDAALLERLGRIHTRDMVFRSYDILRQAGFNRINLDLMFAIPGQTMEIWRTTIAEVLQLQSEHLSCYEVIYEEDTPLFEQLQAGQFSVDEELACDLYDCLVDMTAAHGFQQYEIANFARGISADGLPAEACLHNVNYWRGGCFYGLGPSATGYVRGVRTKNRSSTTLYCDLIESGKDASEHSEKLAPLARAGETAAFGLRMTAGWSFELFERVTGFDLREHWAIEMRELTDQGLAQVTSEGFRLSRRGLRFADLAAEKFIRLESPEKALAPVPA